MILAEIYSWFTEGFDTVDLKDAIGPSFRPAELPASL
jgi:hypothetical protein